MEVQSLDNYLSERQEWMLKFAAEKKVGIRSGRSGCIYKVFKRGEEKSVTVKTVPW